MALEQSIRYTPHWSPIAELLCLPVSITFPKTLPIPVFPPVKKHQWPSITPCSNPNVGYGLYSLSCSEMCDCLGGHPHLFTHSHIPALSLGVIFSEGTHPSSCGTSSRKAFLGWLTGPYELRLPEILNCHYCLCINPATTSRGVVPYLWDNFQGETYQ